VQDPQLIVLASVHLTERRAWPNEYIYYHGDCASSIFLIVSGVVSHVAIPTPGGGKHHRAGNMISQSSIRPGRNPAASCTNGGIKAVWTWAAPGVSTAVGDSKVEGCPSKDDDNLDFVPFAVQTAKSYFGEYEFICPGPRFTSVRAETETKLLAFPRHAFVLLSGEYPQFLASCRSQALNLHRRRKKELTRLTIGRDFWHLAASTIQAQWRRKMILRKGSHRWKMVEAIVKLDCVKQQGLEDSVGEEEETAQEARGIVADAQADPSGVPSEQLGSTINFPPSDGSPQAPSPTHSPLSSSLSLAGSASLGRAAQRSSSASRLTVPLAGSQPVAKIQRLLEEVAVDEAKAPLRTATAQPLPPVVAHHQSSPREATHGHHSSPPPVGEGSSGAAEGFEATLVREQLQELVRGHKRSQQQHAEIVENQQEMMRMLTELHFCLVHER